MKLSGVGTVSALIYTIVSLVASGIFLAITAAGSYNWLTRIGGAAWVFMLSMIILMPVVTPLLKHRTEKRK